MRIVRGRSTVFPRFGERLGDESIVDRSIVFPDVSPVSSAEGCSWTKRNSEGYKLGHWLVQYVKMHDLNYPLSVALCFSVCIAQFEMTRSSEQVAQ